MLYHIDIDPRWLNLLINGLKKYEGRIYKNKWTQMKVGDTLTINHEHNFEITELLRYKNFVNAFNELGQELIPINGINIKELYNNYYSDDMIEEHGVVVFKLKSLKKN